MALSQNALQGVLASATSATFLETLTITHPDINTARLVNDRQNLTRSSGEYLRFPFTVTAPEQVPDRPPQIQINIDAVDQRTTKVIRQLAGKREQAKITYEIVLANTPDTVEFGPVVFDFDDASTDGLTKITIKASFLRGALNDLFPTPQFAPSNAA